MSEVAVARLPLKGKVTNEKEEASGAVLDI